MRDRYGEIHNFTGNEDRRRCFWCGVEVNERKRYCCPEHHELYLKHFSWQEASQWCLERDGWKCVDCGEPARSLLRVHHIDPLKGDDRSWNIKNRPENLVTLCQVCHVKRHSLPKEEKVQEDRVEKEIARGQLVFEGIL